MSIPLHLSPFTSHLSQSSRYRLALLLIMLTLPAIACGLFNAQYHRNNAVRLAVYEYEREARGPVDELVLAFNRDEPRIKFEGQNQNGGRTVWLQNIAAKEFFALRSTETTFLYIQNIEYLDNYRQAIATVYRGDGNSYEGRQLTLVTNDGERWVVTGETSGNGGQLK